MPSVWKPAPRNPGCGSRGARASPPFLSACRGGDGRRSGCRDRTPPGGGRVPCPRSPRRKGLHPQWQSTRFAGSEDVVDLSKRAIRVTRCPRSSVEVDTGVVRWQGSGTSSIVWASSPRARNCSTATLEMMSPHLPWPPGAPPAPRLPPVAAASALCTKSPLRSQPHDGPGLLGRLYADLPDS